MADFSDLLWIDDTTDLSAANFNRLEAGVKDAAQNSKQRGALNTRPAASAATKNWLWTDTNGALSYCDGTAWYDVGVPNKPVGCRVYHNTTQSVAYGGIPVFNTVRWANPAGMRNVNFPSRIYITEDGNYDAGAYLFTGVTTAGNWAQGVIRVTAAAGGTYLIADSLDSVTATASVSVSPTAQGVNLKAGDYLECMLYVQANVSASLSAGGTDMRLVDFWAIKRGALIS